MVDLDITEPVADPTDWVNGLLIKNPRDFSQMSGTKYISKLDNSSGY